MSSSFVKDCTDSSGTSSSRGNKTFIIFVNNDTTTTPLIEGQDFQNLLVNHGADPSNVSVLQMGQPVTNLDFDLPQLGGIEGYSGTEPQVMEQQGNFMLDSFGDAGYAELPIDEDAIKKLERVLHTQEAKDILGDALLDMVSDPLSAESQEHLSYEESTDDKEVTGNERRARSPIRRSQRQMDKAEREEVVKILAENQLMFQKEREEIRKAQEEKEEAEEQQRAAQCIESCEENVGQKPTIGEAQTEEITKPTEPPKGKLKAEASKGKTKPVATKGKNKPGDSPKGNAKPKPKTSSPSAGKGKVIPPKGMAKLKKTSVSEDSVDNPLSLNSPVEDNSSNIKIDSVNKPIKLEETDENLKILKGVLKEVSVNLKKLEVKNLSSGIKNNLSEFTGFTICDASTAGDKLREKLSPVKPEKDEKDQKILVVKRRTKMENGQTTASVSVQNVSSAVIDKLKTISSSSREQKPDDGPQPAVEPKINKNVAEIKLNIKTGKELSLKTPEKPKPKNTLLCPPISKSLMNYKIPHKSTNKAFYTSGYKKELTSKIATKPPNSNDIAVQKLPHSGGERNLNKDLSNPTTPKKSPIKVDSQVRSDIERSISLPSGTKLDSVPTGKHLNAGSKPSPIKRSRPSFEVALNSSKEIKLAKPVKNAEGSNLQGVGSKTPDKLPPPIKTTTVHVKTKPVPMSTPSIGKKVDTKSNERENKVTLVRQKDNTMENKIADVRQMVEKKSMRENKMADVRQKDFMKENKMAVFKQKASTMESINVNYRNMKEIKMDAQKKDMTKENKMMDVRQKDFANEKKIADINQKDSVWENKMAAVRQRDISNENKVVHVRQKDLTKEHNVVHVRQNDITRENKVADVRQKIINKENKMVDVRQKIITKENKMVDVRQKIISKENKMVDVRQKIISKQNKMVDARQNITKEKKMVDVRQKDIMKEKKMADVRLKDNSKETKIIDAKRRFSSEKKHSLEASPVRKSKRPTKKKHMDEQFICPNEEVSSENESADSTTDEESESEEVSDASHNDYDDPNRLWCICRKPHNNRFMICCDSCEDWFHGSCVGVSKAMGKEMEICEMEWNCPKCKPPAEAEVKKKKRKKSKLRKWSDDPKTTNQDPSEARVLVYEKTTGTVLSGNAAPTLSALQNWLHAHNGFSPLLPSMMGSVMTDPTTGLKRIKLSDGEEGTITLSSDNASPVKVKKKKEQLRDAKVSKSRDGGIIIKDNTNDYDPEFEPVKLKTPKKTILIESIHPDRLSQGFNQERFSPGHFYKKEQKKKEVRRSGEKKKKSERREDSHRRVSQSDVDVVKKLPVEEKETTTPKVSIRNNVKKMLFDALSFRKSQVSEEFSDLTSDQLTDLCAKIEEQLFCTFNKDVGFKYKSRYRSLVFNIKDCKNGGLYRQILSGMVSPSKLAKMTSEELASKELAEWRQRTEKMELEAIQKHELEMLQMKTKFVMKTHKGEIEIDKDDFNKTKETAPELEHKLPEEIPVQKEEETADQINHKNHIYDPLCIICIKMAIDTKQISEGNNKSHKEKKQSHKNKRRKRDRDKKRERSKERHRHGSDRRRDSEGDKGRDRRHDSESDKGRDRRHDSESGKGRDRRHDSESDKGRDRRHDSESDKGRDRRRDSENDMGRDRRYSSLDERDVEKRRHNSHGEERHRKRQKKDHERAKQYETDTGSDRVVVSTSDDVVFLPSSERTVGNVKETEPTSTVVGTPKQPETYEDPLDVLLPESPSTPPLPGPTNALPLPGGTPPLIELSPLSIGTPPMPDMDDGLLSPATPPLPGDEDRHTPPPPATATLVGNQPIWRGGIGMQDVATFNAAAFEVSGKAHYFTGDVPSNIDIVGRITPDTVWSYITQIKKTGSKEILVIRFQPSSEEEKVSYIALYCYLSSKKRYGVIGNCEKSVKDFYIVPLAAHQPIPQVLLPLDGPGFEESRPHMLIGVVVRAKHRRIYDTQAGVWIDMGSPQRRKPDEIVSESPQSLNNSPPPEFEEESYTPPHQPESDTEQSVTSSPPLRKTSQSKEQFDMLAELNRQIEKDKEEISSMQKTFDQEMDDKPADEGDPKAVETTEIKLPSNLQDILDNIQQKEVAIKAKELEIERRLHMAEDEPMTSDNPFGVPLTSSDVDLRVLLPHKQMQPAADEDLRRQNRQASLSEMTADESIAKVGENEPERPRFEPTFDISASKPQPEVQIPYQPRPVEHHVTGSIMDEGWPKNIYHGDRQNTSQGGPHNMNHGGPNMNHGAPPNINHGAPPNIHHGGPDMNHGVPPNIHGGPDMNHGGPPNIHHGVPDMNLGGPPNIHHGVPPNIHHGGPDMIHGGAPNIHHGGPDMNHGGSLNIHHGGHPNMSHGGPPNNQNYMPPMQHQGPPGMPLNDRMIAVPPMNMDAHSRPYRPPFRPDGQHPGQYMPPTLPYPSDGNHDPRCPTEDLPQSQFSNRPQFHPDYRVNMDFPGGPQDPPYQRGPFNDSDHFTGPEQYNRSQGRGPPNPLPRMDRFHNPGGHRGEPIYMGNDRFDQDQRQPPFTGNYKRSHDGAGDVRHRHGRNKIRKHHHRN